MGEHVFEGQKLNSYLQEISTARSGEVDLDNRIDGNKLVTAVFDFTWIQGDGSQRDTGALAFIPFIAFFFATGPGLNQSHVCIGAATSTTDAIVFRDRADFSGDFGAGTLTFGKIGELSIQTGQGSPVPFSVLSFSSAGIIIDPDSPVHFGTSSRLFVIGQAKA